MRNKIDLSLPPEELFLNPWQDPGLGLLSKPDFIWRPIPKATITGFAVSDDEGVNKKLNRLIGRIKRDNNFAQAIEYNTVPAVLENAEFRKAAVLAKGKYILSGASGTRLINRYLWVNKDAEVDADAALEAYYDTCRTNNEGDEIPLNTIEIEPDIAFALPCRNTFNYYHFLTEALCQLTLLDDLDFKGNVYFHYPNPEDRQRAFIQKFVDALFPELADRVFFERSPKMYERVLSSYDLVGGHSQAPAAVTSDMAQFVPDVINQRGGTTSLTCRRPLSANTVNTTLFALRKRALALIDGMDFSHLPKRFFVGRDERGSRVRHMEGQEMLIEHLQLFGFEYVVFENLSPLEQVAIMAQAEMMVSYHGAGFTNMLFANPEAYVIELGTPQTAQYRWGDFWPMAHVSGCTYINFFADIRQDNLEEQASRDTGGLFSVSISKAATAQILAFIVAIFGKYPELKSAEMITTLAGQLLEAGATQQAIELLEKDADLMTEDADLCLLKADCHKALGEVKSELVALDRAFKADPSRWQTLVRMIWCANSCDRPQVIRWAVSRLKVDFPDRHDNFLNNHAWVRYVA